VLHKPASDAGFEFEIGLLYKHTFARLVKPFNAFTLNDTILLFDKDNVDKLNKSLNNKSLMLVNLLLLILNTWSDSKPLNAVELIVDILFLSSHNSFM